MREKSNNVKKNFSVIIFYGCFTYKNKNSMKYMKKYNMWKIQWPSQVLSIIHCYQMSIRREISQLLNIQIIKLKTFYLKSFLRYSQLLYLEIKTFETNKMCFETFIWTLCSCRILRTHIYRVYQNKWLRNYEVHQNKQFGMGNMYPEC